MGPTASTGRPASLHLPLAWEPTWEPTWDMADGNTQARTGRPPSSPAARLPGSSSDHCVPHGISLAGPAHPSKKVVHDRRLGWLCSLCRRFLGWQVSPSTWHGAACVRACAFFTSHHIIRAGWVKLERRPELVGGQRYHDTTPSTPYTHATDHRTVRTPIALAQVPTSCELCDCGSSVVGQGDAQILAIRRAVRWVPKWTRPNECCQKRRELARFVFSDKRHVPMPPRLVTEPGQG